MALKQWLAQSRAEFAFKRDNRVLTAIIYCFAFLGLGICIASLGPALLELAVQTNSTLTHVGYVFGIRSIGYLVGSFGGPLYDRIPGHYCLGFAMGIAGIGSLLIPLTRSVYALAAVVSLQGAAMGFLDTGSNLLLIYLYASNTAHLQPFMQSMHASFAVGAFTGPLLLRAVAGDSSGAVADAGDAADHDATAVAAEVTSAGKYNAQFYITGVYCIALAVALLVMRSPKSRKAQTQQAAAEAAAAATPASDASAVAAFESGSAADATSAGGVGLAGSDDLGGRTVDTGAVSADAVNPLPMQATAASSSASQEVVSVATSPESPATPTSQPPAPPSAEVLAALKKQRWTLILVTAALLGQYVGMETGYGAFVTAYSVVALGQTEAAGQWMAGAYWAALMVGRIAAVPISLYLKPDRYLQLSMLGSMGAMVVLLMGQSSVAIVWIGSILNGFFLAPIFPTAVALAESYTPVHGTDATLFVVGAATGEALLPFIISSLFESASGGPPALLWVVGIAAITNLANYYLMRHVGRKYVADAAAAGVAQPSH